MIAPHVQAVADALEALGSVFVGDVTGTPEPPYRIVWLSTGRLNAPAVDDAARDLDLMVGVTSVGATPAAALIVADRARALLTPLGIGDLTVEDRRVWVRHSDSRPAQVDRDFTDPTTNRHLAYAVDMYRLTSTPA